MSVFGFRSKVDVSEWEVREAFSLLNWGILWKVIKEPLETGWYIRVYYAVMTRPVAERFWIDGWDVRSLEL
jgi:hypothetical protein